MGLHSGETARVELKSSRAGATETIRRENPTERVGAIMTQIVHILNTTTNSLICSYIKLGKPP